MDGQSSLVHVGSEAWPVWSDPTDELLLLKLLKKLMVVLIERCPNTQCLAVCCVWDCIALSATESTNNGHMSIRIGPRSSGGRCDALGNVLLGYLGTCHPFGCYFDTQHLPKDRLEIRAETITRVTRIIRLQKMVLAKSLPRGFDQFRSPASCGLLRSGIMFPHGLLRRTHTTKLRIELARCGEPRNCLKKARISKV